MSVHLLYIHRMIGPLTQCRLRSYNCFSTHAWRTQGAREATFATSAQGCYGAQRLALSDDTDDTCRNLHMLIDGRAPFKNRHEHSAMVRRRGQGCGGRSFQLTRLGSSRNSLGENEGDSSEEDPPLHCVQASRPQRAPELRLFCELWLAATRTQTACFLQSTMRLCSHLLQALVVTARRIYGNTPKADMLPAVSC